MIVDNNVKSVTKYIFYVSFIYKMNLINIYP